jgi:hypothetical protein
MQPSKKRKMTIMLQKKRTLFSKYKIKKSYVDILIFYPKNIFYLILLFLKKYSNIRKQNHLNLNITRFNLFQHLQFEDFLVLEDFNFNYWFGNYLFFRPTFTPKVFNLN